jgi:putative spermidine/putrescine transport system substrate-binding protein
MKLRTALMTASLLCAAYVQAEAIEPVGGTDFNLKTDVDLKTVTPANFYDVLIPAAKAEGRISFYDFGESETVIFTEIIRRFEAKYGIKVEYHQVDGEQAVQQLIAAKQAGQPSPVDVFWMPNGSVRVADQAGIIANLPLNTMLPSAPDLEPNAATVSRGYVHGGKVVPYHRNVTAIGYDTRAFPNGNEPKNFAELLAFAKANPQKMVVTDPTRGGSGIGFLESAILSMTTKDCQAHLYDYTVSEADATAWANGPCLDPVLAYFKELRPNVEFTNGNTDSLNLMANGQAEVATVWEDEVYDFTGRGLLPPTVKARLLTDGEVGDGDGAMMPSGATHVAGGLLFLDFLMSDEIQLYKLTINGSRSARTKLDIDKALTVDVTNRLVPQEQYLNYARPRIVGTISDAAAKRFVETILQGS